VEVLIAALIMGVALVLIYSAFITSSRSVFSSKLAYMAMQVARETMDELRQIPIERLREITTLGPLGGRSLFALTVKLRSIGDPGHDPNGVIANSPRYPDEYSRIKTAIEFRTADGSPLPESLDGVRLIKTTLEVTWQEQGGKDERQRPGLIRYVTFLGNHSIDPEVRR
jgi:hypothetical protein